MNTNKTPTYYNYADKILKLFVNDKGFIEFSEDISPEFVQFMYFEKTIPNDFLIVQEIDKCPICGNKLYSDGYVPFNLNNSIKIYKQKYSCSNEDCNYHTRPYWDEYIDSASNYTKKIVEIALHLKLICNISYEKITEIIKLFTGTEIRRDTLYKLIQENEEKFISEKEKETKDKFEKSGIKRSDILSYDEQHIPLKNRTIYRLSAIDPVTNYVYFNTLLEKDEFTKENIIKILKPIVDENRINTIVTDGFRIYPDIIKELDCQHKKCNFHKMQNFINIIKNNINYFKRRIKNLEIKIKEKEEKINEIKKLRINQKGRIKKEDKKAKKIVEKYKKLKIANSQLKSEKREYKLKLKTYKKYIHNLSLMLKSKTKKTGIRRYQKIIKDFDKIPKKMKNFIKNIIKEIDNLLLHTSNKDIPTTNNCIELYFKITLQKVLKKKYKTKKGIMNEIRLKTIRWMNRIVLS